MRTIDFLFGANEYIAPQIELIEVVVEKGFANSWAGGGGEGTGFEPMDPDD